MKLGYQHPPAGNPVLAIRHRLPQKWLSKRFSGHAYALFESGTAALSAAVQSILAQTRGAQRTRVLVPAYGCPALVAAIWAAGAEPVFVDFEPARPWLDLADLKNKIDDRTIAVVAVDLFGIPERYSALKQIAKDANIALIQDAAQRPPPDFSRDETGDIVVLSFGRGKPGTILTGGALIFCDSSLHRNEVDWPEAAKPRFWFLKSRLYNALLQPRLFWLPASVPWIGLGETIFSPLREVRQLNRTLVPYLPANIGASDQLKSHAAELIQSTVKQSGGTCLYDLASLCCADLAILNRYPILVCDSGLRDFLLDSLSHIGATGMYQTILPFVDNMPHLHIDEDEFPNAKRFSRTLLTLPVHARIEKNDILKLNNVLKDFTSKL